MLYISDIKENYDSYGLPERFADSLPEYCEECGAPLWMNESLTELALQN